MLNVIYQELRIHVILCLAVLLKISWYKISFIILLASASEVFHRGVAFVTYA